MPHVEGEWNGPLIKLEPAQIFFVVQLFGFRRRADGARRFTTALFAVARKAAKSTLAAGILLYCLCCEPENGPQIVSAATTGDQARIVWGVAKRMVERTHDLQATFDIQAWANAISRHEVGGTFKPINAKASTQDGLNPSALSFDELHAHKTHDLFNVLRSATGARKNPLFLFTTTEGYENPGPWAETRHFAQQLLEGVFEADHFLVAYYAVDDDDDDFDESAWIKANPLLGITPTLEKMRELAIEAKHAPGALAEFRIKRLNRRSSSATGWIDLGRWKRCSGTVPLDELHGVPCWGGLDLASTRDLCAWRLVWLQDETYYTWGRFWVPAEAVKQRTERGSVPYQAWVTSGCLTQTEGDVADYALITREILEDWERFQPASTGYDAWNAAGVIPDLGAAGMPLEQFIQGPRSYNPAMQAFERAYVAGKLRHGGDPVLTWNAANLVPRRDANMNLAPDKKRSAEKIDGMVALLMAFGLAVAGEDTGISGFLAAPIII